MKPFEATRPDGKSYRTVAVEALKDRDYGAVINYSTLGKLLDIDHKHERHKIQATVRQANRDLLKLHKRGMVNVKDVGYRVIEPKEHVDVANGHQAKAEKQMLSCIRFFNGTDLSKLTENERRLHQGQQIIAQALYTSHMHLDGRIKRIEDILSGTTTVNGKADKKTDK